MSTATIKGVEVFAAGVHNKDTYTEQDLDDMVTAFNALDFRPALKVGHTKDAPGAPSYGWVSNLRRIGKKLVADFTDMHDSVAKAIRDKRYGRVSAEVFFNLHRAGRVYRRALKAVALLGAEVPAVAGLVPLHKMEFAETYESIAYANPDDDYDDSPSAVMDRAARRYMREHPAVTSYAEALSKAFDADNPAHRAYAAAGTPSPAGDSYTPGEMDDQRHRAANWESDPRARYDAGVEIEKLTLKEMDAYPVISRTEALRRVLVKNPKLAAVYRSGHGGVASNWDTVVGN